MKRSKFILGVLCAPFAGTAAQPDIHNSLPKGVFDSLLLLARAGVADMESIKACGASFSKTEMLRLQAACGEFRYGSGIKQMRALHRGETVVITDRVTGEMIVMGGEKILEG